MADDDDINIRYHSCLANFSNIAQNVSTNETKQFGKLNYEKRSIEENDLMPLEFFLNVEPERRRRYFFQSIKTYDIVIGEIVKNFANILTIVLHVVLYEQKRWIFDLNIEALVDDFTEDVRSFKNPEDYYEVGDKVKGVVTYVERETEFLKCSFKKDCLMSSQKDLYVLGKLDVEELDEINSFKRRNHTFRSFEKDLSTSVSFVDPHCLNKLLNVLELDTENASFLPKRDVDERSTSLETIRNTQSFNCSMQLVRNGVALFKEKRNKEALDHFEQAITLCSTNVEAYVARGALHANKDKLKEALEDFRQALALEPNHKNGKTYFIETSVRMAKSFESKKKWKESGKCYKEILKHDPNNKDAKERFYQVNQILSNKIILGHTNKPNVEICSSSSLAASLSINPVPMVTTVESLAKKRSKEKIERLKRILLDSGDDDSSDGWIEKPLKKERRKSESISSYHTSRDDRSAKSYQYNKKSVSSTILGSSRQDISKDTNNTDKSSELSKKLKHFSTTEMEVVKKLLSKDSKKTDDIEKQKDRSTSDKSYHDQEKSRRRSHGETRHDNRQVSDRHRRDHRRHREYEKR